MTTLDDPNLIKLSFGNQKKPTGFFNVDLPSLDFSGYNPNGRLSSYAGGSSDGGTSTRAGQSSSARVEKNLTDEQLAELWKRGEYNYQKFFDTFGQQSFDHGESASSIPFTTKGTYAPHSQAIRDYEDSDDYIAFSQYVLRNAESNESVKNYLRKLDEFANKNRLNPKRMFNEDGTLVNGWQDIYKRRRRDQMFGFYHLIPGQEKEPHPGQKTPPDKIPPVKLLLDNNPKPWELTKQYESKYPGWSDWIPLTMKKINDDWTAIRNGELERKKRFPLKEAPYKQAILTNDYATRQMLEQQKNELRSRAAMMDGSDINQNLRQRMAVEDQVQKLNDKQIQLKQDRYNQTKKEINDIYNWNRLQSVDIANYNRQSNTAAWNWILDSRIKQNEKLNANLNTYIGDMYTNYGEYLKTKRLNDNAKLRSRMAGEYSAQLEAIADNYENLATNPMNWEGINSFISALGSQPIEGLTDQQREALNLKDPNNPTFKSAVLEILKYNTQSPVVKQFRDRYTDAVKTAETQAQKASQAALARYRANTGQINMYETNQWGPSPGWFKRLFGGGKKSVLSQKSGGRVQLLIDFANNYQKEAKSIRENTRKRNKDSQDNLNKKLDRITQEELILLRSVFK